MDSDQIFRGPDGTALRFFHQPSLNNFHTEKAGQPTYDTSLMVEVMVPGMRESTPQIEVERVLCAAAGAGDGPDGRIVKKSPKYEEYREQIEAFKRQTGEGLIEGTPLTSWPQLDAGTAATLKAAGIHTVEQLATVHDGHLPNLGIGGLNLRTMAQSFLNSREFGVPSAAMANQVASLQAENAELKSRIQQLEATLTAASRVEPTPPPPLLDTFGIDDKTTNIDGVDGLGTPAPTPAPFVAPEQPEAPQANPFAAAPSTEPLI